MFGRLDPLTLGLVLGALALVPVCMMVLTAYLKISVVLMLVRNALGVQQVPPNMVLYGLAFILSLYVMSPVFNRIGAVLTQEADSVTDVRSMIKTAARAGEPLREFLYRRSRPEQRAFFIDSTKRLWPPLEAANVSDRDWMVVAPAFVVGELTAAFEAGFLLYLPFVVIDLIVSNVLLALGMMMVSPTTISLPLKLLLFVMADGWTRLVHGLVMSYA